MPRYEYRCPVCGHEQEAILPFSEMDVEQECERCGQVTERRISLPRRSTSKETGRDHVLATLNRENGQDFPCVPRDRPRMEQAYAKGLDRRQPLLWKGF